jgi:hypothetical protein
MDSLLNTYLRQRDLRNFLRAQKVTIARQLSAVDDQIRRLMDGDACLPGEIARSTYRHHYLVGILDAITSFYERETRKRLGLELYRDVFVRYLHERFLMARHEADGLFTRVSEDNPQSGMRDGYADGLQALRGGKPRRLLDFLMKQSAPGNENAQLPTLAVAAAAGA